MPGVRYAVPPARGWGLYYDPLYGYIPLPPFVRRALDLPSMQRLRWLKQLSTVDLVFPGASHSRLEHSVGVFRLASTAFEALFTRREFEERSARAWPQLGQAARMALELAGLFHDVGHGPWSHAFETFCQRNPDWGFMKHDHQTRKIIAGEAGQGDIPDYLQRLSSRLEAQGGTDYMLLQPGNVALIATGQPCPQFPQYLFLSELISGEFDVDRMDYLQRDPFHAGVGVGTVDVWEIIHNLTIVPDRSSTAGETSWVLRILPVAAEAYEALLTARDLAYRKVYYHKTHRSAQQMLLRAMQDVSAAFSKEEMSSLTDVELLDLLAERGTPFAKDVAQRIRKRALYEPLPIELNPFKDLDQEARTRLFQLACPTDMDDQEKFLACQDEISKSIGLPVEQKVIFDIEPTPISRKEAYTRPIFYDDVENACRSLMKLCPHLELTHGEITLGSQTEDLYLRYLHSVTKLLILVPAEILETCVRLAQEAEEKTRPDLMPRPELFEQALRQQYLALIRPILDRFLDCLGLHDLSRRQRICAEFDSRAINLLRRIGEEKKA